MDDEMKRFLKEELERGTSDFVNGAKNDPDVEDIKAPPELHEKLFEQIRRYNQEKTDEEIYEGLPEEYKKLVEFGRIYKRKQKTKKYVVLAAALVLALAVGVTSLGGPERIFKEIRWKIGGRGQVNVDSEGNRILTVNKGEEEDAYQKVKDTFGFEPVRMKYLPKKIWYAESTIDQEMRMAQFVYEGKDNQILVYQMNVNYRQGSVGFDVEDKLLEESVIYRDEIPIEAKHYQIGKTEGEKWIVKFEHRGIQYFMTIHNLEEEEIKKIIKNLKFF